MTTRKYSSRAQQTTLSSSITSSDTTMTVGSGANLMGGKTPAVGETYTVVIDPDTALEEIVDVSNYASGNTLTIARGIDGSTGVAHSAGAIVRHMVIGRDLSEANTHVNGTLAQHTATTSAQLAGIISDETGSGSLVFATTPTLTSANLVTPALGTPSAAILTNATGLPISTGVVGLGSGVATFLAVPSSANLASTITDETGSGALVFGTSPTITTPTITNLTLSDSQIVFEGATADAFETTLTVVDPTADRTITLPNITGTVVTTGDTGTVTSTMLLDGTILNDDINASAAIDKTKISGTAVTVADTGTVTSTMILDGTILNADINASAAIDKTKISGTAITAGDTGTVTSTMILDGTILNADINASAAIDKTKISGTAVTVADTGTVTSTMLLDGTIVNADVNASAAIAYSKLNLNGTITSADIVDGTIVAGDIANGTITAAKMVTDPYARANHTGTQLAATVSDFDTQVRTSRLDQMAAPTAAVALNAQKITGLGTPTANTTDAATTAYVDTQITNLVGGAPGILDTLGEIATQIQSGGTFYDSLVLKSGSTMTGALTLSGAPTVNLHAATKAYVDTVAGSATAAAASAAAAAASYDSFDDRYLGAYASNPALDNDGNALITGAIYFNTVSAAMLVWSGTAWGSISSSAEIYRYKFIAAGGETSVSGPDASSQTLSYIVGKEQVYLNGVLLVRGTDYTATTGSSITALAALVVSDVLEVITFTALSVVTDIPQSVVDAKGDLVVGTAADTVGRLGVGTNGQYLQADSTAGTGLSWVTPAAGYSAPTLGSTAINSGATVTTIAGLTLTSPTFTGPALGTPASGVLTNATGLPLTSGVTGTLPVANGGTGVTTSTGTGNNVLSAAPTFTGTVTATGDITISAAGAFGSIVDFQTMTLMGAL